MRTSPRAEGEPGSWAGAGDVLPSRCGGRSEDTRASCGAGRGVTLADLSAFKARR